MANGWPTWTTLPDVIIPIPLHWRRKRMRGFNQSNLLAIELGSLTTIETDETALKRVRHTDPQVGLTPREREENVQQAFSAMPDRVRGKRVLLIDDVYTTGATLTSAASTLLQVGAISVSAYCLARAVQ